MQQWNFWDHSRCPCCQHPCKDKVHLLICPSKDCWIAWEHSMDLLEEWMESIDTDPNIKEHLMTGLCSHNLDHAFEIDGLPHFQEAAQHQSQISWLHLTEGKLATTWIELQQHHYKLSASKCSVKKWASNLVTEILQATHAQWLYHNSFQHNETNVA